MTAAALAAITVVAAGLRLVHLGDVPGNPFYDAAVHTMSQSWHAFVFGALDPSGGVSVDKPPVDLWFQVAAVKLLGFNGTALKLPQALAGTASVPLLYDLVRRAYGRLAGLAAAAALAVLPVAVMTARSDTMDTFMVFLLLCAAWLVVHAIETGRIAWLLAGGAVLGLAFNVKLFEALLPLPALAVLWAIGSALPWRRRVAYGAAALAVAAIVGLAWIVPVSLTPAGQRPYPIGSTNGSVWNLVFVFNGVDRLKGRALTTPDTLPAGTRVSRQIAASQTRRSRHLSTAPGFTRLLGTHFGPRIGTELLAALLAIVALAIAAIGLRLRRERFLRAARNPSDPVAHSEGDRLALAVWTCFVVWLGLGFALFSAMRSFHPRYFETVSPALAACLGIGLAALVTRGGRAGRVLAAALAVGVGIYAQSLASYLGTPAHYALAAGTFAAVVLLALAFTRRLPGSAMAVVLALGIACVLVAPAAASWQVVHTRAFDAERSGAIPAGWIKALGSYLARHRDGTRYSFASIAPAKAAPLVAADPQPVLMLTSYRSRPLLGVRELAHIVRAGEVRYFLVGRRCTSALTRRTAACPATARWAIAHSTDVTRAAGLGHRGLLYAIEFCARVKAPGPARARGRNARRSSPPRSARSVSPRSPAKCVRHPSA